MLPAKINFDCPQCNGEKDHTWASTTDVYSLMLAQKTTEGKVSYDLAAGYTVKPYTCKGCGYTILFDAGLDDINDIV